MYRKYFFKNKGVLSRRFVASGLAAVFSAGMFGSYAGAMEAEQNFELSFPMYDVQELGSVLKNNSIQEDNNAKEVFKFFNKFSKFPEQESMYELWQSKVEGGNILLKDQDFLIRVYAYLLLYKFNEFDLSIDEFLKKWELNTLTKYFDDVTSNLCGDTVTNLLNKIKNGWGEKLLEEVKKEELGKDGQKIINEHEGAMEPEQNFKYLFPVNEKPELAKVLYEDSIKADKNAEKVFEFLINHPDYESFLQDYARWLLYGDVYKNNGEPLENKDFFTRVFAYFLLFKFYEFEAKSKIGSIDVFLNEVKNKVLLSNLIDVKALEVDVKTDLLNKIKNGWGKELLDEVKEKVEKEKLKENEQEIITKNFQNENTDEYKEKESEEENEQDNLLNKSINEHELDKDKTKNQFSKKIFVVPVVIILLVIFFAKELLGKGNSNTGDPNNNKNDEKVKPSIEPEKDKDDEKVNPSIEPGKDKDDEKVNPSIELEKDKDDEKMNPSTDPESDEQNPEQNNQEERPSVVPSNILSDNQNTEQNNQEERPRVVLSNILKATGATVTAGTLTGGTYLFNKVLKSSKPSEVKNSRNVDNKYMYLDSDGNEVTKTEEVETHDNYVADNENANNSGKKQLLEDKDAEEKEEEQEEILERSALSDDTEATSDEDKNKD